MKIQTMMTIQEAKERIAVLVDELDWLDVVLDAQIAADREVEIDETPASIRLVLVVERAKREGEWAYLKQELLYHEREVRCIDAFQE